ncbi:hypothetical protein ABK040_013575 [Willaertia magna]
MSSKVSLNLDSNVCPRCAIIKSKCTYKKENGVCGNQIFDGKSYCLKEFEALCSSGGDSGNCFSKEKNKELLRIYSEAKDEEEKAKIREIVNEEIKKALREGKIKSETYKEDLGSLYNKLIKKTKNTKRKRKDERPSRSTRYHGSYEEAIDIDCNDNSEQLERTSNKRKILPSEGKLRCHFTEIEKDYFSKEYTNYIKENNNVYPPISWFKNLARNAGEPKRYQVYRTYWKKVLNKNMEKEKENSNILLNNPGPGAIFPNPPPSITASVAVPTSQLEHNDNNTHNHLTSSSIAPNVDKETTISVFQSTSSASHLNPVDDEELFTLLQQQPSCMLPFPPRNQLQHGDTISTASTIKMEEEDEVEFTGFVNPTVYTVTRDIKFCIKHEERKKIFRLQSGSFVGVHHLKDIVKQKFGYIGPLYFLDPDVKIFIEIDDDAVKCIKELNLVFLSTNPNENDYSKNN